MSIFNIKNKWRNIRSHAFYNVCLMTTIIILSAILFAGSVIKKSLQTGVDNMQKRLGADIMLVPKGAGAKAENLLLEGQRSAFYFNSGVFDKLQEIEGVTEITSQCFLKSLSADCCSSEVEIVFFDPESDFTVGPWIEKEYNGRLDGEKLIVGNSISVENDKIKLFGREYQVVSKMAKTGTALDSSVYFSMDAMPEILDRAEEKGSFLTEEQKNGDIISSVFINISDDTRPEKVVDVIHQRIGDSFDAVYPRQLNSSLAGNLSGIKGIVGTVSASAVVLLSAVLLIINGIIMNQRKQEIALYRVLGKTRKELTEMLVSETGLVSLTGALAGCFLSALAVIPFGTYIGMSFNMPYLGPGVAGLVLQTFLIIAVVLFIAFLTSIFLILHFTNMQPYLALRREE